jgi:uncharacterized membrane protein
MKSKYLEIPVKIIAGIIAIMILLGFGYVFFDFIQNPFHPPATLSEASVRHVMTAVILFAITIFGLYLLRKNSQ